MNSPLLPGRPPTSAANRGSRRGQAMAGHAFTCSAELGSDAGLIATRYRRAAEPAAWTWLTGTLPGGPESIAMSLAPLSIPFSTETGWSGQALFYTDR